MPYVTYTAVDRGTLLAAHTAGESYTIEFDAQVLQRSQKRQNHQRTAMGGRTETLRVRKEIYWDVPTDFILQADLPEWYEFLDSVDAGETFTLDPYGTVASPDDPLTVELEGNPSEPREGSIKIYKIQFRAKVAA